MLDRRGRGLSRSSAVRTHPVRSARLTLRRSAKRVTGRVITKAEGYTARRTVVLRRAKGGRIIARTKTTAAGGFVFRRVATRAGVYAQATARWTSAHRCTAGRSRALARR